MSESDGAQPLEKAAGKMTREEAIELLGQDLSKIDEGILQQIRTEEGAKWAEEVRKQIGPTRGRSIKNLIVNVDGGGYDLA